MRSVNKNNLNVLPHITLGNTGHFRMYLPANASTARVAVRAALDSGYLVLVVPDKAKRGTLFTVYTIPPENRVNPLETHGFIDGFTSGSDELGNWTGDTARGVFGSDGGLDLFFHPASFHDYYMDECAQLDCGRALFLADGGGTAYVVAPQRDLSNFEAFQSCGR